VCPAHREHLSVITLASNLARSEWGLGVGLMAMFSELSATNVDSGDGGCGFVLCDDGGFKVGMRNEW
jgi:hypothetical protein